MAHADLHQALKTDVVDNHGVQGLNLKLVRLQRSKTEIRHTLHAEQTSWNLSGRFTPLHVLHRLGFSHGECAFSNGQPCVAREVPEGFDIRAFATTIAEAAETLRQGLDALLECGFYLEQQLFGTGGIGPLPEQMLRTPRGDGHNAASREELKKGEDDSFRFVLTFIKGPTDKGWTIHYVPKHLPISAELGSMLTFLGLRKFESCPEADFEPCLWRFVRFVESEELFFGPAEIAHKWFDAHAPKFSSGISKVLESEAAISKFGLRLLPGVITNAPPESVQPPRHTRSVAGRPRIPAPSRSTTTAGIAPQPEPAIYDVAISFAGPERPLAETLAERVRAAGLEVFYDAFYADQLWGKDLAVFFDEVFRQKARFCVILVSKEYVARDWTNHERRSAVARMITSKGQEYILPVKVEEVELPGLQPTIGYLALKDTPIEKVAEILIAKLTR
jgi:hypothetical protein